MAIHGPGHSPASSHWCRPLALSSGHDSDPVRQGMPQIQGVNGLCPTPSVKEFTRRIDRPRAFPEWFLAAFPDVASWAVQEAADRGLKQDERALALQENLIARYKTLYPGDNPETPDGSLSLCYLKNLAEFYFKCLGRRPECRL